MTKSEQAVALFREGFSCSQAVLAAYADEFALPRDTALRLAQPFGGGIGRTADWCGAVTGALMVLGLKYGRVRKEDVEARDRTYALVGEFIRRFSGRHGSVRCRDLLGCDISTPGGRQEADERHLHETRCEDLVRDAVTILEALL
jgi:C_GCAxxG_C_C family probable redox protein